ncbi:golgin subfamily A member 5-like [Gossypium australe]|uniref:Golgin subfamily A member 5-like n=1 Tax=Gossypium australe TaxID=47621 RepID=A0A5B6W8F2_9ROSI|nr:golgin subfamily A member 5-like [Gossypium australe]
MNITGISEQWIAARIKWKSDSKYIPWRSLRDLILTHPDVKKRVDVLALLGHIDEAVSDLFDRLDKRVTPVPAILAETFRSLNSCRRADEGRFIGCTQFLAWFHSHFWKVEKVSYGIFSENYSPQKELMATPRQDDITEEKWMVIIQSLQEEDVEWRAPWMVPDEILYRCGDFDWVPLLGICGAVGYAHLLVLRQYRSRQFIPATHGLAQCEFSYKEDNYKRKIREMSNAWNQIRRIKRFAAGTMTTPEYNGWWSKRVNDNIPGPNQEDIRPMEEYLRVVPSELEIIKQDFERKNLELGKKIDLKTDYKKLRTSVRTAGLGKTFEQWKQEIQEEKTRADQWEKKFHDTRVREDALKKSLLENQNEKERLMAQVAELEKALHQHRSRNSMIELRASLGKIEELKRRIEELETVLQNCELWVEILEANNEWWKERLHQSQD